MDYVKTLRGLIQKILKNGDEVPKPKNTQTEEPKKTTWKEGTDWVIEQERLEREEEERKKKAAGK